MIKERKTFPVVISAFPGTGKTWLAKMCEGKRDDILDLESSPFHLESGLWPRNYIKAIWEAYMSGNYSYILVSCHKEVREAMRDANIDYVIVAPYLYNDRPEDGIMAKRMKSAYLTRYLTRGSSMTFIQSMHVKWGAYLSSLAQDPAPKIWLFNEWDNLHSVLDDPFIDLEEMCNEEKGARKAE